MAASLREKIMDNLTTTLEGITTAAGYEVNMQRVFRIPLSPFDSPMYPFAQLVDVGETLADGRDEPVWFSTWNLQVLVGVGNDEWIDASKRSNMLLASVQKAVAVDPKRGGFAIDTTVVGDRLILNDEAMPYGGGELTVVILYRHRLGDPYTQT